MNITLFNDITTNSAILEIEKQSEKYDGLYVDMRQKEERKFVKDKAQEIGLILKRLDRARIDKSKAFKVSVEKEAELIKRRLEDANKPFSSLIEEYKLVRERELVREKEIQAAKDLAFQLPLDHQEALDMDELRAFKIEKELREQKERDELIAKQAIENEEKLRVEAEERAEQAEKDKILAQAQAKRDAEAAKQQAIEAEELAKQRVIEAQAQAKRDAEEKQARELAEKQEAQRKIEANKKHVGAIRRQIKEHIMNDCGIGEDVAKKVVMALLKIDLIKINY